MLSLFARTWGDALAEAVHTGVPSKLGGAFSHFLGLFYSHRPGRVRGPLSASKRSAHQVIQGRLEVWHLAEERSRMLQECQRRSVHAVQVKVGEESRKQALEGHIVKALRLGDVKKALRLLVSAPLADKGPDTVAALRKLLPTVQSQSR